MGCGRGCGHGGFQPDFARAEFAGIAGQARFLDAQRQVAEAPGFGDDGNRFPCLQGDAGDGAVAPEGEVLLAEGFDPHAAEIPRPDLDADPAGAP